jgi:hypothetical protein
MEGWLAGVRRAGAWLMEGWLAGVRPLEVRPGR